MSGGRGSVGGRFDGGGRGGGRFDGRGGGMLGGRGDTMGGRGRGGGAGSALDDGADAVVGLDFATAATERRWEGEGVAGDWGAVVEE